MERGSSSAERCEVTEDDHNRCIIHIDIDCFYAQVEMLRNPELRSKPLGIQQKNIVVTCNYLARSHGVGKCMSVTDALRVCPELVLVRGEDLQHYRKMSQQVHNLLKTWGCAVERLGLDENFIDVSGLVSEIESKEEIRGHLWGEIKDDYCTCKSLNRLKSASVLAETMRHKLKEELGITCCAGVGHNKLLAKLATSLHRPDQQTTVLPYAGRSLLCSLPSTRNIPGVGAKTAETLDKLGLYSVKQLQECSVSLLRNTFSADVAAKLKSLSVGADKSEVRMSGKAASLGLEDSFKVVSVESEVRERFTALLRRLLALLGGEGGARRPGGLRLTIRHHAPPHTPCRTTRHLALPASLFRYQEDILRVSEESIQKIMDLIMRLFRKLIDLNKPFHLTLIGLAFTKFQDVASGKSSIAGYLMNSDVSVQSVMDLENDASQWSSNSSMECSVQEMASNGILEADLEPSPKKLCVGELRLAHLRLTASSPTPPSPPPHVDRSVFEELPPDVQQELRATWACTAAPPRPPPLCLESPLATKNKSNPITRYFIPNKQ